MPAQTDRIDAKEIVQSLRGLVGERNVLTDPAELAVWGTDWTKVYPPKPTAVVLPASTAEVAAVLKYCNEKRLAVVPSGGRTGLAGGAVAPAGEIVLSLSRMDKIEELDTVGMSARCQAGVTTQRMQEAAREAGMFFALDLASKGSAQIGGNIATNAGGLKVIHYGGTREQVLGVEVVLASGEVLNLNSSLRKNNTGYDLKQLFIASEGTLGVVTRATLRLWPLPKNMQIACLAVASFELIPQILRLCNLEGIRPTAFEFFTRLAHEIVLKHAPGARSPFAERAAYYVLIEFEMAHSEARQAFEGMLEKAFEQGLVEDAVISSTSTEFKDFWGLRENITESISRCGHVRKNDIALEIAKLDVFIAALEKIVAGAPQDIQLVLFGHIGDGNIHINYIGPRDMGFADFQKAARKIEERVFALVAQYDGSISAEHGIGLLKKADLKFSRGEAEIHWMRQIKQLFDPNGILNPGKIF